jgi:hypothetical protein
MNPVDASTKWLAELKLAKREDEKFIERGDRIIRRYRDDRKTSRPTANDSIYCGRTFRP